MKPAVKIIIPPTHRDIATTTRTDVAETQNIYYLKLETHVCHIDGLLACLTGRCGICRCRRVNICHGGCLVEAYVGSAHLWCEREGCGSGRARVTTFACAANAIPSQNFTKCDFGLCFFLITNNYLQTV